VTQKTKLLGFGEPITATQQQCAQAVMFGKFLMRDDEASYWEYQGNLYVLPRAAKPTDENGREYDQGVEPCNDAEFGMKP
jgi:hypothetical protein